MTEKIKLFDFLNAINLTKKNLFEDPEARLDYVPFLVNKGLSFNHDTIMYANEMNRYTFIPKEWNFAFYLNGIPKKKRYGKWVNKDKNSSQLNMLMEYYNYSSAKAEVALSVLSKEQLTMIEEKQKRGGRDVN